LHWDVFLAGKALLFFTPLLKTPITEIFLAADRCHFFFPLPKRETKHLGRRNLCVETAGDPNRSLCALLGCKLGAYFV